ANVVDRLPHKEDLISVGKKIDELKGRAEDLISQWQSFYEVNYQEIIKLLGVIREEIAKEDEKLENTFKELPAAEGKTGRQVGIEFQNLLKDVERIRPKKALIENSRKLLSELSRQRQATLNDLSEIRSERSARVERSLKKLSRKLQGKMRLTVDPEADRQPIVDYLLACNMDNVGSGRLKWVFDAEDFSPVKLAQRIRQGADALQSAGWGI